MQIQDRARVRHINLVRPILKLLSLQRQSMGSYARLMTRSQTFLNHLEISAFAMLDTAKYSSQKTIGAFPTSYGVYELHQFRSTDPLVPFSWINS